ncbi:MAG: translation initiation factor IF-2 [Candidatus Aenigmarchaeota archaeon ex4484_52]|nr:MAG: translation initiation factor IF-2 [Candidatus Aenigmarchaeota archaeon ex4484_52]
MFNYRQPIVCILAHVDHGKTTLLDYIRHSSIAKKEAGGITQHIGASEIKRQALLRLCSKYIKNIDFSGVLFIDTPGHEAFSYLRQKGGALADISILLIDITEGIKPQTIECIEILKNNKTPFCIAANKIDKIPGWVSLKNACFEDAFKAQEKNVKNDFEIKLYKLIGDLTQYGFNADLYSRITSFENTICTIPISAKTGEGVSDLISIVVGLSQKYLKKNLETNKTKSRGEGVIIEAKETKGVGRTIDVILYNGIVSKKDIIIAGTKDEPIVSKVKTIIKEQLGEKQNIYCNYAEAASGIKISAANVDQLCVGFPVVFIKNKSNLENEIQLIKSKIINELSIKQDDNGVIVKADTIGSIQALCGILKNKNIKIKSADIGFVKKQDILLCEATEDKYKVIFAYNVDVDEDIKILSKQKKIQIFKEKIIYNLIKKYDDYIDDLKKQQKENLEKQIIFPFKIKLLDGCIFRKNHPFIGGFEILCGVAKNNAQLMDENGRNAGRIEQIQINGKTRSTAQTEEKVAISSNHFNFEKNIKEKQVFYSFLNNKNIELLKEKIMQESDYLSKDEKQALEEIEEIKNKSS